LEITKEGGLESQGRQKKKVKAGSEMVQAAGGHQGGGDREDQEKKRRWGGPESGEKVSKSRTVAARVISTTEGRETTGILKEKRNSNERRKKIKESFCGVCCEAGRKRNVQKGAQAS